MQRLTIAKAPFIIKLHQYDSIGLVLIERLIPGFCTVVSLPAGLVRMPFISLLAATFTGASLLGYEWALIGAYLKQIFPYLLAGGSVDLSLDFYLTRRFAAQAPVQLECD